MRTATDVQSFVPTEYIERRIYMLRDHKVLIDRDLAVLYGVTTGVLNQAVKRHRNRFPADFMFQLNEGEMRKWKSQIVISNPSAGMGLRKPPYAFTEQGVAMLSGVLNSERAVRVNIEIMRAFVRLRQLIGSSKELTRRLNELEGRYDAQFKVVFDAIRRLMLPSRRSRPLIGFRPHEK